MSNYVVLMKACIAPEAGIENKPGNRLKRSDPMVRLADYCSALDFWLAMPDDRIRGIVFADNSGYDLSALRATAQKKNTYSRKVEFLSLSRCIWPEHVHYGYCELEIIDRALAESEVLKGSEYFIKATGRLTFSGLGKLLDRLEGGFLCAVDCHDYKLPFRPRAIGLNGQMMLFNTAFYRERFIGINKKLKAWVVSHMEDLLFQELTKIKTMDGIILRWPAMVSCVGYSATPNEDYSSLKNTVKKIFRGIARRILPGWWI